MPMRYSIDTTSVMLYRTRSFQVSASQMLDQLPRERQSITNHRHASTCSCRHQRGHAVPAALWMALRAWGSAPNITALHRLCVCCSVSSQGGVPPWLKSTRLTPGASGSAVMPAGPPYAQGRFAPRAARLTSPLCGVGCVAAQSVAPASPGPGSTRLSRGFGGRSGHAGRPVF